MPLRDDNPLTFGSLYASEIINVRSYQCRAGRGGPAAEECAASNDVVLMHRGAFAKHFGSGRHSAAADVNQAVFFSKGSTYRISHPADCGDSGTVFTVASSVLNDIIREVQPAVDDRPERPFPFVTSPCDSRVFWRRHEFVARLLEGKDEPLWAEATALELVAGVLQTALARHGLPRKARRKRTDAGHIERVEAAKNYLAGRLGDRVTLGDVARAVDASPFHLARVFRDRAGMPIHRYLTRLRLRAAVGRLADGARDLTSLALELGFSSHSHFSDAFRQEFGRVPSQVRRILAADRTAGSRKQSV